MGKLKLVSDHGMGPMLACALADAYGAGFEFRPLGEVRANNDLTCYRQHQKWKGLTPGRYTDDTQMAMGLAEHMLNDDEWRLPLLAERWVDSFKRDPRPGYSGGFYDLLQQVKSGMQLMAKIRPTSNKNGGAMRAWPVGLIEDTATVRDLAMLQASLTHCTAEGMAAAAAAALMFHHRYHALGSLVQLPYFLEEWVPGWGFSTRVWKNETKVPTRGVSTVLAAMTALCQSDSMAEVLLCAVAFTGDTDTVAAIALPAASVCEETNKKFPQVLIDGLEDGNFGRKYIQGIDEQLLHTYAIKSPAPPPVKADESVAPDDSDPLAFLFEFLFEDD